jgi:TPR repeat protein
MSNFPVFLLIVILLVQSARSPANRTYSNQEKDLTTLKERAEAGDVKAQVQLGLVYASGGRVEAGGAEAVKWFQKAANQGNASGEYYLGELYATGRGVPAGGFGADYFLGKIPTFNIC